MVRRTAMRVIGVAVALASCLAGPARADVLDFDGDLPAAEHLLLALTAEQQRAVAAAARQGEPAPEVTLSGAQRRALKKAFGVEPRWILVVTREAMAGDPGRGASNLGVLAGGKLAVLAQGLGDHLGQRDVAAMERALTDRSLAVPGPTPFLILDAWRRADGTPEPFTPLGAHLPTAQPDGALRLPKGWTAQRLRLAGVPRLDQDRKDPAPTLHALAAIAGRPSAASLLRWPELGARREAGGAVLWLVPGLVTDEAGPPRRAWVLLQYRGGALVSAVVVDGDHMTGVLYVRAAQGG